MKKLFLSLIAAITFCIGAMAENNLVATLQHGSHIKAYYGVDAFTEAHTEASDGDIITLSTGVFNGCSITKALTIRGEGMEKTSLSGNNNITIPQGSPYTLFLEGLYFDYFPIKGVNGTEKVVISKCNLGGSVPHGFNAILCFDCNATIIQSVVRNSLTASTNSNVTCQNCQINGLGIASNGRFDVQNCVITGTLNVTYSSIKNSIVYNVTALNAETNITSHCLVKEGSSGFADSWYITATAPEPDPWGEQPSVTYWNDLFSDGYHLTEEASQTYLGTDGTQVGIYGGMYPYETTPDYPTVKRLDVIGSHKDGKLNVKINVE